MAANEHAPSAKVQALLELGRYREALGELGLILGREPDRYSALCEKAICHLRLGEFQRAFDSSKAAIRSSPEQEWAYRIQSLIFTANGEHGRALEAAEKAFSFAPDIFETRNTLFYAQAGYGHLEEAAATLPLLLEVAPDNASAHFAMGYLALKQNDLATAEASFLEALKIDPEHTDSLNNLGVVYLQFANSGRGEAYRKKSVDMFERAVRTKPTYKVAQQNIRAAKTRPVRGQRWLVLGLFFFLLSSPLQIVLFDAFTEQIDETTTWSALFSPFVGVPLIVVLNLIVIAFTIFVVGLRIYYLRLEDRTPILIIMEKRWVWWFVTGVSLAMLLLYIPAAILSYSDSTLTSFPGIAARILFVTLVVALARLATMSALQEPQKRTGKSKDKRVLGL